MKLHAYDDPRARSGTDHVVRPVEIMQPKLIFISPVIIRFAIRGKIYLPAAGDHLADIPLLRATRATYLENLFPRSKGR